MSQPESTPPRSNELEQFVCTACAGSGRVMQGPLTSAVCYSCDGFGTRRIRIEELKNLAAQVEERERERCAQLAYIIAKNRTYADEPIAKTLRTAIRQRSVTRGQ